MIRKVRGLGTLVPEEIRWIAARTPGRVDQILLRPGAKVEPDSLLLILTNPDVEQAAQSAESQLQAAQAALVNTQVQLERGLLEAESTMAAAKSNFKISQLQHEINADLSGQGLVSKLDLNLSEVRLEEAETRYAIEKKRLDFTKASMKPQLAVQQAEVDRAEADARIRREEFEALHVRAGIAGVLQQLPLEVGQRVQPGADLARVADPTRLKAEVRIAETQAKDVQIGQIAMVDTRNGIITGTVSRVDPAVQNGTVTVDVLLSGNLPKGARPDLSVDGTIQLEKLDDVIYVGRPAFGQERSTVGIFKLTPDKAYADRTRVELGRSSVNTIEIISGLAPGDEVILSDMSQWDDNDRVRLD
jgi:HlyD family secretion protein